LKGWRVLGVNQVSLFIHKLLFVVAFVVAITQPVFAQSECEKFLVSRGAPVPEGIRSIESIASLKVVTYNVANLLFHIDPANFAERYSRDQARRARERNQRPLPVPPEKPLWQLPDLAKAIKDLDFDIGVLQEAGDAETLFNFNEKYLGSKYRVIMLE
jgi:hypothetical protein